jgi:hypothetical protein
MGQIYSSYQNCSFRELYEKIDRKQDFILINVLPLNEQSYLIKTTLNANQENDIMNHLLKSNKKKEIIIYGRNHQDLKVIEKYNQLKKLGFINVFIYFGGLFEWALLQEVYGVSNFPSEGTITDPIQIIK